MSARKRARQPARDPFEPLDGPIGSTLDLHGHGAADAERAVATFLRTAYRREPGGLVHLITGKGHGSRGRPVLKPVVRRLLQGGGLPAAAWGEDLDGGGYLVRLNR